MTVQKDAPAPAKEPQVVTSNSNVTAPAANSGSLANGTAVGGLVQMLYVAGVAGTDIAQGSDSADGSRATPKLTLAGTYTAAGAVGTTNVIIVLTPLKTPTTVTTFGADKTIIITSEITRQTITTGNLGGGTVTVKPENPKAGDKVTITVKPDVPKADWAYSEIVEATNAHNYA